MSLQVLAIVVPVIALIISALLNAYIALLVKSVFTKIADTNKLQAQEIASLNRRVDEHLEKCDKVDKSVLESRLKTVEEEAGKLRKFAHWVNEGLVIVLTKLQVDIPKRPSE